MGRMIVSRFGSRLLAVCLAAGAGLGSTIVAAGENWPQFRGPRGDGVAEGANLPDEWSAADGRNIEWKTDIPGRGWSSPIVWGQRVFLTTAVNSGETEPAKKGLYFFGERLKKPESEHQWKVLCLKLDTGAVEWERTAHAGVPATGLHIKNTYASETPVTDGERVYAYFGNLGLFCYDLEGNLVWSKMFDPKRTRFGWGTAASPALHQGRLYIVNDNDEDSYLMALDARTGDEVWRTERPEKSNWATPFVWQNDQRTEIVTAGTGRVRSYDLDGKLIWELGGMSSITIGTPLARLGMVYLSSGYVMDQTRPVYAIRPGGTGDISLADGESGNSTIAWRQPQAAPYNPSVLVYGERLYVLFDRGLLACYNAKTGEVVYDKQRIADGGSFTSSPWAYNDRIFCANEDGVTSVFAAGDEFKLLRTNKLGDDEMCMATPAIAGERLLVRTDARLYSIRRGASRDNAR